MFVTHTYIDLDANLAFEGVDLVLEYIHKILIFRITFFCVVSGTKYSFSASIRRLHMNAPSAVSYSMPDIITYFYLLDT